MISKISLSSAISVDSDEEKIDRERGVEYAEEPIGANSNTSTMAFQLSCATCSDFPIGTNYCSHCSAFSIRCGICQEGIRGSAIYCPECLHGGHVNHISQWFGQMSESHCPTGCGCECSIHMKPSEQPVELNDNDSDDSISDNSGPSRIFHHSYSESSGGESDDDNSSEESSQGEEEEAYRMPTSTAHQKLFQKRRL